MQFKYSLISLSISLYFDIYILKCICGPDFNFRPLICVFRDCELWNKAFILLVQLHSVRRVPLCDWLDLGVKVKTTANADVDFCCKMASVVAVMQTNRSDSVSSTTKRTRVMTQRRLRAFDYNVLLLLALASMLHCALADGKTLVLLDNLNIRDTHSIFFRSLAGQCNILTFSSLLILSFLSL